MKAIVQDTYGSPDVLQLRDIAKPEIGDDDVLVRVRAASVNPQDWHIMRARPFIVRSSGFGLRRPKKPIRGTDVAGSVEAVGRNVTSLRPGDEVFGWCEGAFAEYVSVDESHLVPKPAGVSFEAAGSVAMAGCTAIQGLRDTGAVKPGQEVLIIGAGGGVGTFAVQIAKAFGARVTGVCGTTKMELVRSLGADHVIDYTREDFTRGEQRYDVIFQLAGTASPSDCRRALTPKGTLVLSSGEGRFAGIDRILRAMASAPFVRQRLRLLRTKETNEDLVALTALMEAGKLTPVIAKAYPLSEVPTPSVTWKTDTRKGRSSSRHSPRAQRISRARSRSRTLPSMVKVDIASSRAARASSCSPVSASARARSTSVRARSHGAESSRNRSAARRSRSAAAVGSPDANDALPSSRSANGTSATVSACSACSRMLRTRAGTSSHDSLAAASSDCAS
jgi:NADPH:quinone reductase-like Zn-dependent oxidoreductase